MDDEVRNIGVRGDGDVHHVAEVNGWASKLGLFSKEWVGDHRGWPYCISLSYPGLLVEF